MKQLIFKDYASITAEQKAVIIESYKNMKYTAGPHADQNHLAACVADSVFTFTKRQRSGPMFSNAYAAVLTVLVMAGYIKVSDGGKA